MSASLPRESNARAKAPLRQPLHARLRELLHWRVNRDQHFWLIGVLAVTLLAVTIIALGVGPVVIEPLQVVAIALNSVGVTSAQELVTTFTPQQEAVLLSIRAPRVALGILVGAGLAVAGATLQGLFRNPLADPTLIGVSSGAAFSAVAVIVLGSTVLSGLTDVLGSATLPVAAFAGGVVTTIIVFRIGTRAGYTDAATVLLAGIAINAIASAGIGLLTYIADDEQLRTLTFWTMGSLGGTTWSRFSGAAPFILLAIVLVPLYARALNALLLGEAETRHLGFDLQPLKRHLILLVAMAVGASVAVTGIIGFIGLVVPHLLRLIVGPDYRSLLPGAMLLGAVLLLAADLVSRTIVAPAELPIGIITSVIGGPFFIWLLMRRNKRVFL
ncbi:MAG: iron chelate uptake ABC transporter family permease subunit [Pseudomonadota bacterium]